MSGYLLAASLGGGALGALGSIIGGGEQAAGAQTAANTELNMFQQTQNKQLPFWQAGVQAQNALSYGLGTGNKNPVGSSLGRGSLTDQFNVSDWQTLSPQYQFVKQQGDQGVLNQDATSQGALSGASMKDLLSFNSANANTSFNSAFQNYQTQQGNIYNRLAGIAGLGQGAASNQATGASQFGAGAAQAQAQVGTALGGATVGAANAGMGGLNNAALFGYLGSQQANPYAYLSNPTNLGGSTPVSGSGTGLTYDQYGNITGG